jgi:hypothetical protein
MSARGWIARQVMAERKAFSQEFLWSMHSRGRFEDLNCRGESCKMFAVKLSLGGNARFCLWARARGAATDQNLTDIREHARLVCVPYATDTELMPKLGGLHTGVTGE